MPPDASFESSVGFLRSQLGVLATRSWADVLAERDPTPHHLAIALTIRTLWKHAKSSTA
jgi:hypothetical protein